MQRKNNLSTEVEATIDAPRPPRIKPPHSDSVAEPCMSLVEGSGPGLSSEIQQLLRRRLRISAVILFCGFGVFFIQGLFTYYRTDLVRQIQFWPHLMVIVCLGLCGAKLCRRCDIGPTILRIHELLVFALPAAFFLLVQHVDMTHCAQEGGYLPNPAARWLMLIFTYAMFIPNHWPRAAAVIGSMGAAPVIHTAYLVTFDEFCRSADSNGILSGLLLMMLLAAVGSVVGVHTIGSLRRQAFEAKQLGRYQLRQRIGAGGMGEVYLAEHQLMKRACAIKIIRPEKAGDPTVLARFEREVRATAKLSHWNSIDIFDYGRTDDGTFYYVMEYLPGLSVSDLVTQYGPLSPERAIHFLIQTCNALAEAHSHGVIHRDIKPANIFAAHRGGLHDVTKLLDFGLAKPITQDAAKDVTMAGSITGSPLYMSPEQAVGDTDVDGRSDIYSLGCVAYFMLTGQALFDDEKPIKILLAHSQQQPPDLASMDLEIPDDLAEIVAKCLKKSPSDRYQTVEELRAALRRCRVAGKWTWDSAQQWWNDRNASTTTRQLVASGRE